RFLKGKLGTKNAYGSSNECQRIQDMPTLACIAICLFAGAADGQSNEKPVQEIWIALRWMKDDVQWYGYDGSGENGDLDTLNPAFVFDGKWSRKIGVHSIRN